MKTNRPLGGRKPKLDKRDNRYVVRFTDKENARFIAARIFNEEFKVLKFDKHAFDYYTRLTNFYGQFRAIGTNYNQIVLALKTNFTEKKALAFLYKLEKETIKLVELSRKIAELTEEFKEKYG